MPFGVCSPLLKWMINRSSSNVALPMSKRVFYDLPGRYDDGPSVEIQTILDRLAKPVLPRHLAAKARQSNEAQAA